MKWISIQEASPQRNKHIAGLCYEEGHAYYYAGEIDAWGDFNTNDQNIVHITHWAEWPDLP